MADAVGARERVEMIEKRPTLREQIKAIVDECAARGEVTPEYVAATMFTAHVDMLVRLAFYHAWMPSEWRSQVLRKAYELLHKESGCVSYEEPGLLPAEDVGDFTWTLELQVAPVAVADGIDFSDAEKVLSRLLRAFPHLSSKSLGVTVLSAPDPKLIRKWQGYEE